MKESVKTKLKRLGMWALGFSAAPILTACYGMPTDPPPISEDSFDDINGTVVDSESKMPVAGIEVSVPGSNIKTISDENGRFFIDRFFYSSIDVNAKDVDGAANGEFEASSQRVTVQNHDNVEILLNRVSE